MPNKVILILIILQIVSATTDAQSHYNTTICEDWNYSLNQGMPSRTIQYFDSVGLLRYDSYSEIGLPSDSMWSEKHLIEYEYDSLNHLTKITRSNFWAPFYLDTRTIFSYDSLNRFDTTYEQSYNGLGWDTTKRTYSNYDQAGNLVEWNLQLNNNSVWINSTKTIKTYDTNNNLMACDSLIWNTNNYDTLGKVINQYMIVSPYKILSQEIIYYSNGIRYARKLTTYSYDSLLRIEYKYRMNCDSVSCTDTTYFEHHTYNGLYIHQINDSYNQRTMYYNSDSLLSHTHYYIPGTSPCCCSETLDEGYIYNQFGQLAHTYMRKISYCSSDQSSDCWYFSDTSDSLHVDVLPDTVCPGDYGQFILSITGGHPPYSINWQSQSISNQHSEFTTAIVDSNSTFPFSVIDSTGNTFTGNATGLLLPSVTHPFSFIQGNSQVCPGRPSVLSAYQPNSNTTSIWTVGPQQIHGTPISAYDTGMVYLATTTYSATCFSNFYFLDSLLITSYPLHPVNLGLDTILCTHQAILLDPAYNYIVYHWSWGIWTPTLNVTDINPDTITVSIIATDSIHCLNMDTIQVIFQVCTKIGSPKENPFEINFLYETNELVVQCRSEDCFSTHLKIINVQGQIIYNKELSQLNNRINLSHLKNGVYFYNVGEVEKGKFLMIKY